MVRRDIITEEGVVAQELLKCNYDENKVHDVIVIGSGMGGGIVASALADEGKEVLILEAGSLLFPTHVGNLPRRLQLGKFQKQLWSLYDRFTVENYDKDDSGDYAAYCGAQAFNLGGRSMFWGASIPELAQWELDAWPKSIQEYLTKEGFSLAKRSFNATVPQLKAFHGIASEKIQKALGDCWTVEPASVAVEYSGATEWTVPSGVFSTADLLIEDSMVEDAKTKHGNRQPLTVNLHQQAWSLCFDGNRVDGVNCFDLLNKKQRTFRAKAVVLAAGTLESAKIALQSNISNPLIGQGITDHPIWYRHFVIPPHAKALKGVNLYDMEPESTKLIIRHKSATIKNHGFDIVVELGSQWNQGRFVDFDHVEDEMKARNGYMLCEIVFQFYSELEECNNIKLQGWNKPVRVHMKKCPTPLLEEARAIATQILKEFDADKVYNEPLSLYDHNDVVVLEEAKVGGVAHEVGTLRMPSRGQKGVVDEHLKFEGYDNLFACDNSVFPCSPAGNPSLTLAALARRCAKDIVKVLHGEPLTISVPSKYPLHEKYGTREAYMKYVEEVRQRIAHGGFTGEHPGKMPMAWDNEEFRMAAEASQPASATPSATTKGQYPLHEKYGTREAYMKYVEEVRQKLAKGEFTAENPGKMPMAWDNEEIKMAAEASQTAPASASVTSQYPLHEKYGTREAYMKYVDEVRQKIANGEFTGQHPGKMPMAWDLEELRMKEEKEQKETPKAKTVAASEISELPATRVVAPEAKTVTPVVMEIVEEASPVA